MKTKAAQKLLSQGIVHGSVCTIFFDEMNRPNSKRVREQFMHVEIRTLLLAFSSLYFEAVQVKGGLLFEWLAAGRQANNLHLGFLQLPQSKTRFWEKGLTVNSMSTTQEQLYHPAHPNVLHKCNKQQQAATTMLRPG